MIIDYRHFIYNEEFKAYKKSGLAIREWCRRKNLSFDTTEYRFLAIRKENPEYLCNTYAEIEVKYKTLKLPMKRGATYDEILKSLIDDEIIQQNELCW